MSPERPDSDVEKGQQDTPDSERARAIRVYFGLPTDATDDQVEVARQKVREEEAAKRQERFARILLGRS